MLSEDPYLGPQADLFINAGPDSNAVCGQVSYTPQPRYACSRLLTTLQDESMTLSRTMTFLTRRFVAKVSRLPQMTIPPTPL
jgi:hypothetical protein